MFNNLVRLSLALASITAPFVALAGNTGFCAELPWPGIHRGTYHIDRWGQHRFIGSELAVSPELEPLLKPYLGQPISLDITRIGEHPSRDPSKGMILHATSIRKLPTPVDLRIKWKEEPGARGSAITRVTQGGDVKLKLTLTNRSAAPLALKDPVRLGFYRPRPSGAGRTDPMHYWPGAHMRWFHLAPKEQTLDVLEQKPWLSVSKLDPPVHLDPGESRTWTVDVTSLPANEYEVAARYSHYQEAEKEYVRILSNILRLDVLTDEPKSWQDLEVQLESGAAEEREEAACFPIRARFKNSGKRPLWFALRKIGDYWDVNEFVLCYDARGTLWSLPTPTGKRSVEKIRLEPGKELVVPACLPGEARVARVAFYHRVVLEAKVPGDRVLGTGYVFSPHILLKKGKGSGVKSSN